MSDASREFSLDRKSFGAKKQKHKLLLQKQWLNPCTQVQLPRGLCNWMVPTKTQRQGKLRQFSRRQAEGQSMWGMGMMLREDELFQGHVGSLSKAMESRKSTYRRISGSGLCLQACLGCGESRVGGTVEWKELWRLSKTEKKEGHS